MVSVSDQTVPARSVKSVTPSDSENLPDGYCRAIYIGGDGNLRVLTVNDEDVTFNSVVAGTVIPVYAKRVYSTSTTATNIMALY